MRGFRHKVTGERVLWLALAGAVGMFLYSRNRSGTATGFARNPFASLSDTVMNWVQGWKNVGSAQDWLPTLAQVEIEYDLPTDLLARMAYQESHFRESIIRGTEVSAAGALGILQLLPQYFQSVKVPIPFSDVDVTAQIEEAANYLSTLYHQFGSWSLALAAYNAGPGNVQKYGGIPPFPETQAYVAQVLADVPAAANA